MNTKSPYYDHDFIWEQRRRSGNPVWGSYSHKVYHEVLELVARFAEGRAAILDVGCGAGAFGVLAANAGLIYRGVDASAVAIEIGHQHHSSVQLEVGDYADANYSGVRVGAADIVTSINVLHCLTGQKERHTFLRNLCLAAKDDGVLILTSMIGPVPEAERESRLPRAYVLPDDMIAELKDCGWKSVLLKQVTEANATAKIGNLVIVCRKN